MRFEYSPETPDDWPPLVMVTATEVDEPGCGIEEGDTVVYEPSWKHRMAGETIREQREQIAKLEFERDLGRGVADMLVDRIEGAYGWREYCMNLQNLVIDMFGESTLTRDAFAPRIVELGICTWEQLAGDYGIEVPDEVER